MRGGLVQALPAVSGKMHSQPAKKCIYVLPAKSEITELLPEKRKYIHCLQKGAFTASRKKSTFTACKKEAHSMPAKRKHIRGLQKESTFTDCNKKAHSLPAKRKHIHCLEEESAFTVCQKKALSLRTANLICIRKILFIV